MIAIYARQSVDKKDSISIESQIDFCKKEIPNEKYKVYTDKGFSGGNIKRPAFEQMLKDIKKNQISKVVVYKLDRISRSILDFSNIIEIFKKHDVDFISATEKFDTSAPIGRAMLYIIMVFAQLERETIQNRIKDNYYARGKKGFFLGGKTPYGCIKESAVMDNIKTSILKPSPKEFDVLMQMFKLYSSEDISLGKLSRYLNDKNIKSPNGVNWDGIKIQRILRNPVYVKADADIYMYFKEKGSIIANDISQFIGTNGCFLFGKRDRSAAKYTNVEEHVLSLGIHEGFVDSDTWLACQYKLDQNKQIKNSGKGKHTWLSGLTKCGYCDYAMTVTKYKDYKYFTCRGRTNYKVCDVKHDTHYVDEVEKYVKKELFKKVDTMSVTKYNDKQEDSFELNHYKLQLMEIEKQIDNLMNQLAQANDIAMKYINKKISELDSKKNDILIEIRKHTIQNVTDEKLFNIKQDIKDWNNLSLEEKKSTARTIIDKIYIKNDEIKIEWKY